MNTHVKIGHEIALQRSLPDVVKEYDTKRAALADILAAFKASGSELKTAASIAGVFGETIFEEHRYPDMRTLERSLLKSAWRHVYDGCNIDRLASPEDKQRWKQALENPAPFTLDNIAGTFGRYLENPRKSMLRALAEVFCGLDPAFKSHDKMKIGVKGLPKRVIMSGFGNFSSSGRDKLESILNALAAIQGKPLVNYRELGVIMKDEDALLAPRDLPKAAYEKEVYSTPGRGVRLRRFENGNGHLFFEPDTLRDINKALAEFYGDVLPDTPDENPKKQQSRAVSKDLQYYPTPLKLVEDIVDDLYHLEGSKVLEPSCGDGRFLDALAKRKAIVYGIEVDPMRAVLARAKGHSVLIANFLETVPTGDYDRVVMNSPFYGKHYVKHVLHAYEFLKPGGTLTAILPVTAKEHGLLDHLMPKSRWDKDRGWRDLPVGSFSESGTNINTVIATIHKPKASQA